ncbi:MAG: metallophosphoesterase [Ruminococcus sp.]
MRILVISDTHGDFYSLQKAVEMQRKAEVIIHCGDGEGQAEKLREYYPEKAVYAVRGNCDRCSDLPATEEITIEGKKIFITHGHLYNVKLTYSNIFYAAKEKGADIVCFGHTHIPLEEFHEGTHFLNPGSCHGYNATFGYIDITPKGIITNILKVK